MKRYEESLKIYRDNYNTLDYAKKEARKEGRDEGIKEGREVGIKEGREVGREERQVEIAKILRKNGIAIELIAKSTGLSEEQIKQLKD